MLQLWTDIQLPSPPSEPFKITTTACIIVLSRQSHKKSLLGPPASHSRGWGADEQGRQPVCAILCNWPLVCRGRIVCNILAWLLGFGVCWGWLITIHTHMPGTRILEMEDKKACSDSSSPPLKRIDHTREHSLRDSGMRGAAEYCGMPKDETAPSQNVQAQLAVLQNKALTNSCCLILGNFWSYLIFRVSACSLRHFKHYVCLGPQATDHS